MTCTLARAWLGALELGIQKLLESLRVDELCLSIGGLESCIEVIGKSPVHAHITVELAEVVVQHTGPCHRSPLPSRRLRTPSTPTKNERVLLVYFQNKKKAKTEGKKCHAKTMLSQ